MPRLKKCKLTHLKLVGGPYDGQKMPLSSPVSGTLPFTAADKNGHFHRGRYKTTIHKGGILIWEDSHARNEGVQEMQQRA